MNHLFIMDPLNAVKPWKDTSYFLMLACQQRQHQVYYIDQQSLWLEHDWLHGLVTPVTISDDHRQPFDIQPARSCCIDEMDVVWIRTDPPFDRRYFYTTLLLDFLSDKVKVINRPSGVRNLNEKLAALLAPDFSPATKVTNSREEIKKMAQQYSRLTLKPIDGFGGKGIAFYETGDADTVIDAVTQNGAHWIIAQEYLPNAALGDKRVLLWQGEPFGAILRVHAEGVELNNMDAGGSANPAKIDAVDKEICARLKPILQQQGIVFCGIDVIDGKLIEVNVTSPTGLQEMSRFDNQDYHHQLIAATETQSFRDYC